MSAIFVDADHS